MPKQRTGYVYYDKKPKTWTVRLIYKEELGRTRNIKRQARYKTGGNQLLKKLHRDIDQHGSTIINGDKLAFAKLAEVYEAEKLIEPVYEDGEAGSRILRYHCLSRQTKEKDMNRMIIQVDDIRVAYDGRDWTPVAGEHAWAIARMMKSRERLYKRLAAGRPDFAYNVARAAAEDFHGRIVEYQPIPPAKPGVIH